MIVVLLFVLVCWLDVGLVWVVVLFELLGILIGCGVGIFLGIFGFGLYFLLFSFDFLRFFLIFLYI